MSDPEVPQNEQQSVVDDVVDSANAGLAEADAARGDVPAQQPEADAPADAPVEENAIDPDVAAFEAAEREHPGTFDSSAPEAPVPEATALHDDYREAATIPDSIEPGAASDDVATTVVASDSYDTTTRVFPAEPVAETVVAAPIPPQHQPIFVQAPEPPRDRGNRGTAAAIGLLATLSFAVLYLGTALGIQALGGDVTFENIGEAALAPLTAWGFWVPVAVFFIGFWLLGAIINRGRWGLWVVFGLIVGVFAWGGHILGQLFEAPFWTLSPRTGGELALLEAFAPLAIAAFIFGRELTIWFGAWVARSGARKTELNAEAQREYERTIEAGPTLSR